MGSPVWERELTVNQRSKRPSGFESHAIHQFLNREAAGCGHLPFKQARRVQLPCGLPGYDKGAEQPARRSVFKPSGSSGGSARAQRPTHLSYSISGVGRVVRRWSSKPAIRVRFSYPAPGFCIKESFGGWAWVPGFALQADSQVGSIPTFSTRLFCRHSSVR